MVDFPEFDFLKFNESSAIPVPSTDHLRSIKKSEPTNAIAKPQKPLYKHEREYDAYCRWRALPEDLRKPKTVSAFEKKWHLPEKYSATFAHKDGFRDNVLKYFWEWMMDVFPNIVYASYKQAMKTDANPQHIKILTELISKHLDIDKPAQVIQPFMIMGVSQDKIDGLFHPKSFDKIEDILPEI